MILHYNALTKDQVYDMLALRNEVFVVEQNCPYQDIDQKDKEAYHLLVYEDDLVAYLRILNRNVSYDEASIGRVLVKSSHRHLKLGKKIMEEAMTFLNHELSERQIRISAQAYLQSFYESLGFECVSDVYLEDDIPHIEMLYDQ